MYPSAGAPEPGYGPGFKQRAAKDFWEGNSRKQQFILLHFCCKMQRLAWNELRSFVSPKPRVRVGTAAAAAQHLRLIRWEGTLLQHILLLLFHIFNLPALLRLSRHSISESPEPWNEHTKKSFKNKFTLSTQESTALKGFQRLLELSLSTCLRVFSAFGVLNLTMIDIGDELSDVDYHSDFSKPASQFGEVSSFYVFWAWIFGGL